VEAAHLPVISFDESSWAAAGDPLFALDPAQGPRRLDVVSYGPRPATEADDLVVSSDSLDKRLRLPTADGILPGSMILNRQGQVVAIFVDNDAIGSSAVPIADFSAQMEPVVRGQAAERPYLGVNYVDLTRLIGSAGRLGSQDKGALLVPSSDGKKPAVLKASPAAIAGLRAGDVILKVNGEEVSAKRSLSDIVSDYRPGSDMSLTVLRGAFTGTANWGSSGRSGAEIEVTLKLGGF
jgi:serine protease Do